MKNYMFTLFLAFLCIASVSCTQSVFNLHHSRSESLWRTQPRINEKEVPSLVRLDSLDARIYGRAVFMTARSGVVKPIEIRVFDQFGNDGVLDTVLVREGPPKSTLAYYRPKLDPGTRIEEGAELDPARGEQYLALAEAARKKASGAKPPSKPRKSPPIKNSVNPSNYKYPDPLPFVKASSTDISGKTEYAEYTTGEPGTHGGRDAALEKLQEKAEHIILD